MHAYATHNRAGEITYKCLGGLSYEINIVTYTYTQSPADRPELTVSWGDGSLDTLNRIEEVFLPNEIKRNKYKGIHTYAGADTYIVSFEDPNRNAGVINIPGSVNVPFYVQSEIIINPFLGCNNSPELLNPPIDNACVGQVFIHNPNAYDAEGDSISYKFINCKGESGDDIAGYSYPETSSSFTLDPIMGDLVWNSPTAVGEYNVAILIEEWRHGVKLGSVTRDMQITVAACNNHPPIIEAINTICVEADSLIKFRVKASDIDGDNITLTGSGSPLMFADSSAHFDTKVHRDTVSSEFFWQTGCVHVRRQPYIMVFKATDDGNPVHLADIESVAITVVGPAPKNLTASPAGNSIALKWQKSRCTNARGYRIFRRNGYYGYHANHCETGVPYYTGYAFLKEIVGINDTSFVDNNYGDGLIHGIDYCYIVIAFFGDGAESYASNEACTELRKDVPIITNVSINNTNSVSGAVYVAWSKPLIIDTVLSNPFEYEVFRSNDLTGSSLSFIKKLVGINDTITVDTILNTRDTPLAYRIDLYGYVQSTRVMIGSTHKATSEFLSIQPFDNSLTLQWADNIPWLNYQYIVFRFNNNTNVFDSIGYSTTRSYTDNNLANGKNYCYKIKSIGKYTATGLVNPIINFSQEVCAAPVDLEKPCTPHIMVLPDCDSIQNTLFWNNPNKSCANDVVKYNLYFSKFGNADLELIASITGATDTFYKHNTLSTIAGCYAIAAIDSFGNESDLSDKTCLDIDSCSLYTLPNVFTPDGNGQNDFFIPFPYKFVDHINLTIFNRWGKIVFKATDPDIRWDGKDIISKQDCSPGVYYYICDVFEYRLYGIKVRTLKGFVHLLRN